MKLLIFVTDLELVIIWCPDSYCGTECDSQFLAHLATMQLFDIFELSPAVLVAAVIEKFGIFSGGVYGVFLGRHLAWMMTDFRIKCLAG